MKTCPKCRGKYPDDSIQCTECNIELIENKKFNTILHELYDMNKEQRELIKDNDRYKLVYIYQFGYQDACGDYNVKNTKIKIQHQNKTQNIPKCPTCQSTNIKRISTLNRVTSIAVFGLLSGKIGKNYECLDCKAKW